MRDEQVAATRESRFERIEETLLRGAIEIDHHVAAEDEVERRSRRRRMQQVEPAELDHLPDRRCDLQYARLRPARTLEVLQHEVPRHLRSAFAAIHTRS